MYKKVLGARLAKIEDKFVIVKGTEVFNINEIGARIFELCNGENSTNNICSMLKKIYDSNDVELANDVQYFISQLIQLELIKS